MYCIMWNNVTDEVIMVINGDNLDTTNDKIIDTEKGWGLKGVKSVVSYDTKETIEDDNFLDPSYFDDHTVLVSSGLVLTEQ